MGKLRFGAGWQAGIFIVAATIVVGAAPSWAVATDAGDIIPPPLAAPRARYFASHPAAYQEFLAQLRQRAQAAARAPERPFAAATGGKWQRVTRAPSAGLCNPLLLTDGTVIAADGDKPDWYKLTPDSSGNYAKGTWSQIASLPVINGTQYAPLYHASAVLPDGRVIIMGGEYNGSSKEGFTNDGAIYDPAADAWTAVNAPPGTSWGQIGDSASTMLADGTFMLASCCAYYPPVDALFNAKKLSWISTGAPRFGEQYQDEQGYELLPDGGVLTIDIWTDYPSGNATNAEKYVPALRRWVRAGNTPVSLVDPEQCGNFEIGPAVLRGDGTLVAFGGNTGCVAGATADPVAIYTAKTGAWSTAPDVPAVCGSDGTTSCALADAPAALLPDGNILFAASAGFGIAPTHFFEFTSSNSIDQVSDTVVHAAASASYYYNFLVLPNGQILSTDFSRDAEVYTPSGTPVSAWAPVIYNVPSTVTRGTRYKIVGAQLGGRSQGAYYGDDVQGATNYPIVKVVNQATGHVVYGRTGKFSQMSVAPMALGTTEFTLPPTTEPGASTLLVIANGIASLPQPLDVK